MRLGYHRHRRLWISTRC